MAWDVTFWLAPKIPHIPDPPGILPQNWNLHLRIVVLLAANSVRNFNFFSFEIQSATTVCYVAQVENDPDIGILRPVQLRSGGAEFIPQAT